MNLKNSVFLFVVLISLFSCGGDGVDDIVVESGPSNLVFKANIVGQDETHPNGDGSGTIIFNFSADNAKIFKINLGNGETKETSANELTYTYSGAGLKTFEINIYAYNGFEFVSSNISVTIQIGNGPLNLVFEANIVGQDETHPYGDGSGTTILKFSADNATIYRIDLGNGETKETSANELTYTYSGAGLKTFEIYISAYNGDEFISSNISVTIQIGTDSGLNLIWYDEFDVDGAINSDNWFHQTQLPAGGNWYNGEVQHYTDRTENSYVSDGTLKIVAKKELFTDQGFTKQYTSARLNSKFAFTYGRIEVRAKLPTGFGTWPAIWMLGKNINEDGGYWDNQGFGTTSWPACGEVDIMEHWGSHQNFVQSAIHTPSSYGNTENLKGQTISTASTQFHTYALEWTSEKMVFSVDDVVHYTYIPAPKDLNTWPFDADQYILLNIAIEPSIDPSFVQSSMEIDYVRVYQ